MIKLIHILKEIITELADTKKSFSYNKAREKIEKNDDGYAHGLISYEFKTDIDIEYTLDIFYMEANDEFYQFTDYDGQAVDIQFSADGGYNATNNVKELFPVMATISKCINDAYDIHPFKYIMYSPSNSKGSNKGIYKDNNGELQRVKLYDYYIKKEFPSAHTSRKGNGAIVTKLK